MEGLPSQRVGAHVFQQVRREERPSSNTIPSSIAYALDTHSACTATCRSAFPGMAVKAAALSPESLPVRFFGIREHEASTRPVCMHDAGVQCTGFPRRGDERQDQRVTHL
jgi:hypothetical protein